MHWIHKYIGGPWRERHSMGRIPKTGAAEDNEHYSIDMINNNSQIYIWRLTCLFTSPVSLSRFKISLRMGSSESRPQHTSLCKHCLNQPRYREGSRLHDYCGKTCAAQAMGSNPQGVGKKCKIPSCHRTQAKGQRHRGFCSAAHFNLFKRICLVCGIREQCSPFHWCSRTCGAAIEARGPCLLPVHPDHEAFKEVKDQLEKTWRHSTKQPTIKYIFKVVNHKSTILAYNTYKDAVEARGKFEKAGRPTGNEQRRFHGTLRECTLGENLNNTTFCSSTSCALCSILRDSFKISTSGSRFSYGRFGKGIYTSSTSSKSNTYTSASGPTGAMILANVIVGSGFKATEDKPNLVSPPAGYDSVLGEVGGKLKYDELIVYNEAAIRPSWLIVYER